MFWALFKILHTLYPLPAHTPLSAPLVTHSHLSAFTNSPVLVDPLLFSSGASMFFVETTASYLTVITSSNDPMVSLRFCDRFVSTMTSFRPSYTIQASNSRLRIRTGVLTGPALNNGFSCVRFDGGKAQGPCTGLSPLSSPSA